MIRLGLCTAVVVWLQAAFAAVPTAQDRGLIDISDAFDAYARGENDRLADAIRRVDGVTRFQRELRRQGPTWIREAPADEVARRRLVVATIALETALAMPIDLDPAIVAIDLVDWACFLLRSNPRSDADRLWHQTKLTALRRIMIGGTLRTEEGDALMREHIKHGEKRYAGDPSWTLATGLLLELRLWGLNPKPTHIALGNRVTPPLRAYEGILTDKAVGAEANVRVALLKFQRDKSDVEAAFAHLDRAEASATDARLGYLVAFVRGWILEQTGTIDRAADAYETALSRWPGGASAATLLAAIRFRQDRRDDARRLAQDALQHGDGDDPWRHYARGDYWLEDLLRALRKAL